MDLKKINDKLDACIECSLCKIEQNISREDKPHYGKIHGYPEEDRKFRLMFVAQNPSINRDAKSPNTKLFCGDSCGNLFTKALTRCGLTREDVYVTNLVKCSTLDNAIPSEDMVKLCKHFVIKEATRINPDFIVCVGSFARDQVMMIEELRKWPVTSVRHPAYVLRGGCTIESYCESFKDTIDKYFSTKQAKIGDFSDK
jgi:uracil-DNA glycosylase